MPLNVSRQQATEEEEQATKKAAAASRALEREKRIADKVGNDGSSPKSVKIDDVSAKRKAAIERAAERERRMNQAMTTTGSMRSDNDGKKTHLERKLEEAMAAENKVTPKSPERTTADSSVKHELSKSKNDEQRTKSPVTATNQRNNWETSPPVEPKRNPPQRQSDANAKVVSNGAVADTRSAKAEIKKETHAKAEADAKLDAEVAASKARMIKKTESSQGESKAEKIARIAAAQQKAEEEARSQTLKKKAAANAQKKAEADAIAKAQNSADAQAAAEVKLQTELDAKSMRAAIAQELKEARQREETESKAKADIRAKAAAERSVTKATKVKEIIPSLQAQSVNSTTVTTIEQSTLSVTLSSAEGPDNKSSKTETAVTVMVNAELNDSSDEVTFFSQAKAAFQQLVSLGSTPKQALLPIVCDVPQHSVQLSTPEVNQLLETVFMQADTNTDGFLTSSELAHAFASLSKALSLSHEATIRVLMAATINSDHLVDWRDALPVMTRLLTKELHCPTENSKHWTKSATLLGDPVKLNASLLELFTAADIDKSGELDLDEFGAALNASGIGFKHEEIIAVKALADTDGNGLISYPEFIEIAPYILEHVLAQMRNDDRSVQAVATARQEAAASEIISIFAESHGVEMLFEARSMVGLKFTRGKSGNIGAICLVDSVDELSENVGVRKGMAVVTVNNTSVLGCTFEETTSLLSTSQRPLRIRFVELPTTVVTAGAAHEAVARANEMIKAKHRDNVQIAAIEKEPYASKSRKFPSRDPESPESTTAQDEIKRIRAEHQAALEAVKAAHEFAIEALRSKQEAVTEQMCTKYAEEMLRKEEAYAYLESEHRELLKVSPVADKKSMVTPLSGPMFERPQTATMTSRNSPDIAGIHARPRSAASASRADASPTGSASNSPRKGSPGKLKKQERIQLEKQALAGMVHKASKSAILSIIKEADEENIKIMAAALGREARAQMRVASEFAAVDTNQDGWISKEEWQHFHEAHTNL